VDWVGLLSRRINQYCLKELTFEMRIERKIFERLTAISFRSLTFFVKPNTSNFKELRYLLEFYATVGEGGVQWREP
jgi:hypothetical protein